MVSGSSGPPMKWATQLVLRALLAAPTQEKSGSQIGHAADLPSGTVHPILARLETCGWLESRWEDPGRAGRARRRYYSLTSDGIELARDALARLTTSRRRVTRLRAGLAEGGPL